ncbi:hypothetical protein ACX80H_10925 [Arthrobacter sp. MDT2-2]
MTLQNPPLTRSSSGLFRVPFTVVASFTVVTALTAVVFGLPLRDPDGFLGPSYIRLVLVLVLVAMILADGKPVAIPETAFLVQDDISELRSLNIKRAWWQQVFDPTVQKRFPQLKMFNWFEWNKMEPEVGAPVDWTVLEDPTIRSEFTAARTRRPLSSGHGPRQRTSVKTHFSPVP